MKKLLLVVALVFLPALVFAAGSMVGKAWNASENFAATSLSDTHTNFDWTYGFKAIVTATADDAVTITITSGNHTVYSGSTTSATSTQVLNLNTVPIPPGSQIALSGVGSGTVDLILTAAKY